MIALSQKLGFSEFGDKSQKGQFRPFNPPRNLDKILTLFSKLALKITWKAFYVEEKNSISL
jgi:hypothetical protein